MFSAKTIVAKDVIDSNLIVSLKSLAINDFNDNTSNILKRYLKGNYRWSYTNERGSCYACLKFFTKNNELPNDNGYYTFPKKDSLVKTRVLISFNNPIGDYEYKNITTIEAKDKILNLNTIYENSEFSSYLIIKSKFINIEIFQSSKTKSRLYTQKIINDISKELKAVLNKKDFINDYGIINDTIYNKTNFDSSFYYVINTNEKGRYKIKAALNINEEGFVFAKIIHAKTGNQISAKLITPMTKRETGWSGSKSIYFYYESEFRVYNVFSELIDARIELWFTNLNGESRRVTELGMPIYGWSRKDNIKKQN